MAAGIAAVCIVAVAVVRSAAAAAVHIAAVVHIVAVAVVRSAAAAVVRIAAAVVCVAAVVHIAPVAVHIAVVFGSFSVVLCMLCYRQAVGGHSRG